MVLSDMKKSAETHLGHRVKNAVVTVPAYFDDSQRRGTVDAAKIADLNVVRIINEPTAAALTYGLEKIDTGDGKKNVLIFDLGGGTLDVTLLEIKQRKIEVKAKSGDTQLGGQDFDNRLVKHFAAEFKRKHNLEISGTNSPRAFQRLKTKCEEVKQLLSQTTEQTVIIDALYEGIDLNTKISRAKFEGLNMDLFKRCISIVESCLTDAKMEKRKIHDVVLVGGSSRIPKIQEMLKEFLNVNSFCSSIDPDQAIAYGAAVQAAILGNVQKLKDIAIQDVTPLSLGVEDSEGKMNIFVPRNTAIPTTKTDHWQNSPNQESAEFRVYEGEGGSARDNRLLGKFCIDDIPRAPGGEVDFEITFHIDENSILTVTAKESKTGKSGEITISYDTGRLTKEQIDRMILDEERRQRQKALDQVTLDENADNIKNQMESLLISSSLEATTKKHILKEMLKEIK